MNKKNMAVVFIVLVVIILPRFYYFFMASSNGVDDVVQKSIQEDNPNLCKRIRVDWLLIAPFVLFLPIEANADKWQSICFFKVAPALKNANMCDSISDKYQIGTRDECFGSVAYASGDIGVCERIERLEDRGSCYGELVRKNVVDSSVCDKVPNDYAKDTCRLASVDRYYGTDSSFCDNLLTDKYKRACYLDSWYLNKTPNVSLCGKIPDKFDDVKKNCYKNLK